MAVAAILSGNGNKGQQDDCERKHKVESYHGVIVAKNIVLSRLVKINASFGGGATIDCITIAQF